MPVWRATGFSAEGYPVRQAIEASDRDEAIRRLSVGGIVVHRLAGEPRRGRAAGGRALKPAERARLYDELGALLAARIPLVDALETLAANATEPRRRRATERLREVTATGGRLSEALGMVGADAAETGAITASEACGALGDGLMRLGQTLERRAALRRAMTGALVYPAILLAVTLVSLLVILLGVVPNLAPLFESAGDAAPASARALLAMSSFLRSEGELVAAGVAGLAVAAGIGLRFRAVQQACQRGLLAMPVVGPLALGRDAAAALRLLASLVAADTPAPEAFALASKSAGLAALQDALSAISGELRRGADLARAVGSQPAIPPGVAALVAVGLRTGRLGPMLETAADTLERETEARIARLMALLPPVMTLLLGGLVGGFSAVIMSAILSANDLAH